jgi:hypothetical protein
MKEALNPQHSTISQRNLEALRVGDNAISRLRMPGIEDEARRCSFQSHKFAVLTLF